ncbi:hypothetical protein FQA39_LY13557 [Lamprigera yunnana]|nr:hypothetical protein FQA39_LY13557 [Lamprigera yunnana]
MEPMALGSAPSSPTTHPNYLPAFLMGDQKLISPNPPLSPEIRKSFNATSVDRSNLRQKLFSPGITESDRTPLQSSYDQDDIRPGPPKQSLFDTIDIKRGIDVSTFTTPKNVSSPNVQRTLNESVVMDESVNLNASTRELNRNLWVTVFGFPSSATSVILARLSNCGAIVDKQFPTQGNWVHLKFNSPTEASKALSLNGKLILSNIMIGVSPYFNKNDKENTDTSLYKTPIRARSLRESFVSPQTSNTVILSENVPQKSTGLVTKAMEYVFVNFARKTSSHLACEMAFNVYLWIKSQNEDKCTKKKCQQLLEYP